MLFENLVCINFTGLISQYEPDEKDINYSSKTR